MMRRQSCANCNAFIADSSHKVGPGQPQNGWCRAKPPNLVQVMVPVSSKLAPQGQQMAPGWQGVFPPTSTDVWCRAWAQQMPQLFDDKLMVIAHEPTKPATVDLAAAEPAGGA